MKAAGATLILATVPLLLAGCSGSNGGDGGDSTDPTTTGSTTQSQSTTPPRPPTSFTTLPTPPNPPFALEKLPGDFTQPVYVTHAGDGSGRLFVVEQGGRVWVGDGSTWNGDPFLDLSGQVSTGFEQGLLSIAFHPDYETNGYVFVDFTDVTGDTVVARYTRDPMNPDKLLPASLAPVLAQDQPYANHNGGLVAFGPDGYLYVGFGDGGSGDDPQENGQDLGTWLGKVLRIDVDVPLGYAVPPDNPFSQDGVKPEIWAYGLRNPWRFSFDRETGDLWIADVGQNSWEEVNFQMAGTGGGENYGWDAFEGSHVHEDEDVANPVFPVVEYSSGQGESHCSVTGGYVHRGMGIPDAAGHYLFGDYCSGWIWTLHASNDVWSLTPVMDTNLSISSFGEDEAGNVYVVDHGGAVHRVVGA